MKAFSQILATKERIETGLLEQDGITGIDIGYKYTNGKKTDQLAIRIFVAKKQPDLPLSAQVPKEINGIVTDVLEAVFEPQHLKKAANQLISDRSQADYNKYNPLRGGISVGPCRTINQNVFTGTLGAIVLDRNTQKPHILSNFHVLCVDKNWEMGDGIAQPSQVDNGRCPHDQTAFITKAVLNNQVDAAIAEITNRGISSKIVGIGAVESTANAKLDMAVRKRGRTSGLTHGIIDSLSLTIKVDFGNDIGSLVYKNQIGIRVDHDKNNTFSRHGDSGALIVNDNQEAVGLLFAADQAGTFGVANPIDVVLDALDVDLFVETPTETVPLYRYWNPNLADHFYTTNFNELGQGKYGYQFEGIQCFVFPKEVEGSIPLYRYWNPMIGDHFYTTDWNELEEGKYKWTFEKIEAYVFPKKSKKNRPTL